MIERAGIWVALMIVVVGALLRWPGLYEWWLNPDEGIYYSMVTWRDSARFWGEFAGNAHPPLFYVILRGLGSLTVDFAKLRLVSFACGLIAIFATYLFARAAVGDGPKGVLAGWAGALLLALSPSMIVMSQVMRPYTLLVASVMLAAWFATRSVREARSGDLIGYGVCTTIALLTHYSAFLAFAGAVSWFGILLVTRRMSRRTTARIALAHVVPVLAAAGLYWFHLRPRLIGSALAAEALDGWLQPFMVDSPIDLWRGWIGVMRLGGGPELGGLFFLVSVVGAVFAIVHRRFGLLTWGTWMVAFGVLAAVAGKYPFGCCRHATWLLGFVCAIAGYGVAAILTLPKPAAIGTALILGLLVLVRGPINALLGVTRVGQGVIREHVLKRSDLLLMERTFSRIATPGSVLMSNQAYYLLLPFFREERNDAEEVSGGNFRRFGWGRRMTFVANVWEFAAEPKHIDASHHLYRAVEQIDRHLPARKLGKERNVLMLFAGWSQQAPLFLRTTDMRAPPEQRLIRNYAGVHGLYAFDFDLATYMQAVGASLERRK